MSDHHGTGGEKRHHGVVRVTHWVNAVALAIMVASGLRIFNVYQGFAPRGGTFCCYPFEGQPVPQWLIFGGWRAPATTSGSPGPEEMGPGLEAVRGGIGEVPEGAVLRPPGRTAHVVTGRAVR